jgi:hypothetical protein
MALRQDLEKKVQQENDMLAEVQSYGKKIEDENQRWIKKVLKLGKRMDKRFATRNNYQITVKQ